MLISRTLDTIYEQVLESLKRSGQFDLVRVGLIDLIWNTQGFQAKIVFDFQRQCNEFCKKTNLDVNRKELRAALDKYVEESLLSNRMLKECIDEEIEANHLGIRTQFDEYVTQYLRKEFQKSAPELDMEVESPKAPEYSPISEDGLSEILEPQPKQESCEKRPTRQRKTNRKYVNDDFVTRYK